MRFISITLSISLVFISPAIFSQKHNDVSSIELESMIKTMSDSIKYYYVSKHEGIQIADYILERFNGGFYDDIRAPEELAKKLTEDLRSVNYDLHLYVSHKENLGNRTLTSDNIYNGLKEVKFLDGDIVYMKFNNFGNWGNANNARQKISDIMPALKGKSSVIIDVEDNPGGVPYVVSYLLSYFFDNESRELSNYYIRYNDSSYSIYTEPNVPGIKFEDINVYVLVNEKTASAAEELAFWLQNQGRATVIGKTTAGAGYGAMEYRLNDRFFISISNESEVDPKTNKGFQKIGVKPDLIVRSDQSLNKAIDLARTSKSVSSDTFDINNLRRQLDRMESAELNDEIFELINTWHMSNALSYNGINELGYEYMTEPKKASAILKVNTILYPFYPNSFDSYAEALWKDKQYELAKENYMKAIELASQKNHLDLELYQRNFSAFKKQYDSVRIERDKIRKVLMDYIEGTSNGEPDRLKRAFHHDLNLYSVDQSGLLKTWNGQAYILEFKEGEKNNRLGKILEIDYENNAAIAKVEIKAYGRIYIDYFLLLKLQESWTIIHKSYTRKA